MKIAGLAVAALVLCACNEGQRMGEVEAQRALERAGLATVRFGGWAEDCPRRNTRVSIDFEARTANGLIVHGAVCDAPNLDEHVIVITQSGRMP